LVGGLAALRQKLLLRGAALLPQPVKLDRIQFTRQRLRHVMRQRGIHVVAAQQDMIAHRDSFERDLASLLWAQHQIGSGDPALLESRLKALAAPDNGTGGTSTNWAGYAATAKSNQAFNFATASSR